MDAIVTAGGIPKPEDKLYPYSQGKSKALIEMAGKPMAQWVLDALSAAEEVERIVVIGLDESNGVTSQKPLHYVSNHGGMIENIKAGTNKIMELNPDAEFMLIASSDIPTITGEMVDWTIRSAMEHGDALNYNVITRETMERRFPGANRTYLTLKDHQVCGGDMNVVATWTVTAREGLWNKLEYARKSVFRQAALIGYDTLLLVLLRQLTLESAAKRAVKRLGISGRAIMCPYAEIAMDVDKPHQLEILREDLANRAA